MALAACLAAWTLATSAAPPTERAIRPAPARPAVSGFARDGSLPSATRPAPSSAPRALPPANAILPACLTSVDCYALPSSRTSFGGAGISNPHDATPAVSSRVTVGWWANAADVDKSGLVLLFAYTQEFAPSRVRNVARPLSATARGRQTADFAVPGNAGRIVSWHASLLQRGRPLSTLHSPDWTQTP